MKYDEIVRQFPVGVQVAVSADRGGAPIVVEQNQGGFVVPLSDGITRTIDGDVDFARFDRSRYWQLGEFEFDKAVLAVRRGNQAQRFRRMLNIARYRGFHEWPGGSTWLDQLMSETRLTPAQRAEVAAVFQRSSGDAR